MNSCKRSLRNTAGSKVWNTAPSFTARQVGLARRIGALNDAQQALYQAFRLAGADVEGALRLTEGSDR
jgi:hypothetical protein